MTRKKEREERFRPLHELVAEAHAQASARKEDIRKRWFVHDLVSNLDPPSGEDAELYTLSAYYAIGDLVDRMFRANKEEERGESLPGAQLTLPGYARLQSHYSLRRVNEAGEEETVYVHVENATDEELLEKADSLHAQSDGLLEHERELRDYVRQRRRERGHAS